MKKNLRYCLLVATLMLVASLKAQVLAQDPVATMQSTSTMAGSGSTLPSAVAGGTSTSYGESGDTYSPASGPRRVDKDNKPKDPLEDPIGATPWLLMMLLLGGYAALAAYRRREEIRG